MQNTAMDKHPPAHQEPTWTQRLKHKLVSNNSIWQVSHLLCVLAHIGMIITASLELDNLGITESLEIGQAFAVIVIVSLFPLLPLLNHWLTRANCALLSSRERKSYR